MLAVGEGCSNEAIEKGCISCGESQEAGLEYQGDSARVVSKTRKSAETRNRIMSVASQLMVERGNTAFQMSEVSDRCGMSKGALYYYFSDKSDLVNAVFGAKIESFITDIERVVSHEGPVGEIFLAVNKEFTRCISEDGILAMAMMWELVCIHEGTSPANEARAIHIVDVVADLLESAKEAGIVRADVDGRRGVAMICGALTFGALCSMDSDHQDATFPDQAFDLLSYGFCGQG